MLQYLNLNIQIGITVQIEAPDHTRVLNFKFLSFIIFYRGKIYQLNYTFSYI